MRLIDADRLLEILEREEAYHSDLPQRADGVRDAIMDVISAPTVDAVPARHGKWVDENGNRPYGYRFNWLCSECGRPQHTSTAKLLKEFEEEHRWCHFCGARMDGKGNGNETD